MTTYTNLRLYNIDPFGLFSQTVGGSTTYNGPSTADGMTTIVDNQSGNGNLTLEGAGGGETATADVYINGNTSLGSSVTASESWTVRDTVTGQEFQIVSYNVASGGASGYYTLSEQPLIAGRVYETVAFDDSPDAAAGDPVFTYDDFALDNTDGVVEGSSGDDIITAGYTGDVDGDVIDGGDSPDTTETPLSLNWSAMGADNADLSAGGFQDTGGIRVDVSFQYGATTGEISVDSSTTQYTATGEDFNATSSLYLVGPNTGADTTTTILDFSSVAGSGFDNEVQNVTFRVNDIDGASGSWVDQLEVRAYDADGNLIPAVFELQGNTNDSTTGSSLTGGLVSDSPDSQNGSALVTIAGPVARIELEYDNIGVDTSNQVLYITDVHFEATAGGDEDIVDAGDGNDLVESGLADDIVYGGGGDDTVDGGAGNDTLYGDTQIATGTPVTGSINSGNYSDTSSGYTVTAQNVVGGSLTTSDVSNIGVYGNGFGASGTLSDSDSSVIQQTGYDLASGLSENVTVDFDNDVDQLSFSFEHLYTQTYGEQGHWAIYNDGVLVAEGDFTEGSAGSGSGTVDVSGYGAFDQIVFTGLIQTDLTDGSDFTLTNITYTEAPGTGSGGIGADSLSGGAGDDVIYGEDGNDTLSGGADNDTLDGGAGADTLLGGTGADSVYGGDGDDRIVIEDGFGADTIVGGEAGETNGDTLDLSATTAGLSVDLSAADPEAGTFTDGTDTASFSEIENIILGGGADTLVLADGSGADQVAGFETPTANGDGTYSGIDQLDVSGLTDATGNPVNTADVVVTDTNGDGTGDAILNFPNGETLTLTGVLASQVQDPAQLVAMGIPADGIVSGTDAGETIGPAYTGDPDGDMVDANDALLPGETGDDDIIEAAGGDDLIYAGNGNDEVYGGTGNDTVHASTGDDLVYGEIGNDVLLGEIGNDTLHGGDGDDTLIGGVGSDSLTGGAGSDVFTVTPSALGIGNDTIVGGETGSNFDTIELSALTAPVTITFNGDKSGTITYEGETITFSEIERLILPDGNDSVTLVGDSAGIEVWAGDGTDTVIGGAGGDTILGFDGNDSLSGGAGDDQLDGDGGNDTLSGGTGADTLVGDAGDDVVFGGDDNDQLYGNTGADSLDGGAGADLIYGMDDADTIVGGAGDTIDGGEGGVDDDTLIVNDVAAIYYDTANPENGTVEFNDGTTLSFTNIENVIGNGGPDGIVDGTDNNDLINLSYVYDAEGDRIDNNDALLPGEVGEDDIVYGYGGDDVIESRAGNDEVYGGTGNDTIVADAGNDFVDGGANNDQIFGGTGDDTILGGAGDDELFGNAGADSLDGGAGADTLRVSSGDTASGGDGDDVFNTDSLLLNGGDFTIDGGEGDETTGDTLNVVGPAVITYDTLNPENGTVEWLDGSTLTFSNIENLNYVPCFTRETLIKTRCGERRAADLHAGDMVLTRDNGFQPLRWVGMRHVSGAELGRQPGLRPVLIRAGSLGLNQPERDLLVSPQHRMLVAGPRTELWFGEEEVLVAAINLTCLDGVEQIAAPDVTYVHFMFDNHEIVCGDGAWSESYQPGDMTLSTMDAEQRAEIFTLFPELKAGASEKTYPAARPTIRAREARVLFS